MEKRSIYEHVIYDDIYVIYYLKYGNVLDDSIIAVYDIYTHALLYQIEASPELRLCRTNAFSEILIRKGLGEFLLYDRKDTFETDCNLFLRLKKHLKCEELSSIVDPCYSITVNHDIAHYVFGEKLLFWCLSSGIINYLNVIRRESGNNDFDSL